MHGVHGANRPATQTDWIAINWRKANRLVRNLRQRIFRACEDNFVDIVRDPYPEELPTPA